MAQSKREIQAILSDLGSRPRQQFGQNFMIDQNLVRLVAAAGDIGPQDCVIEIGPGTGTLTEELLGRCGRLIAVEIDRQLAELLRQRFSPRPSFVLIQGDALAGKHDLNSDLLREMAGAQAAGQPLKLVANLPYNIASPLVIEMLIYGVQLLAFTVQKEVALRLRASAGTEDYGPLSVMAQMLARVELLRTLPPQAFWPAPKVESALVRMVRDDRLGPRALAFGSFVHRLFSFRRKTLRRALQHAALDPDSVLGRTGFDGNLRPEELTPQQLLTLFDAAAP